MKLIVNVATESVLASLRGFRVRLIQRLVTTLARISIEVQRDVKGLKLSGQVLHVRTGTLRRSINREVKLTGDVVEAVIGTNVAYAHAHEYGFKGKVDVREHLRTIKMAWGRALKEPKRVTVHAHQMMMNLPERSFLRSVLREREASATAAIRLAATESVFG